MASFELPSLDGIFSKEKICTMHRSIASRTILAAARGGRLRRLNCSSDIWQPFAIRTLLPCWVHVDYWGYEEHRWGNGFLGAAATLRPLLAHASLWLGRPPHSAPRSEAELTPQDVQSLQEHFEGDGLPIKHWRHGPPGHPVNLYLPWLTDPVLANEV